VKSFTKSTSVLSRFDISKYLFFSDFIVY